MQETIYEIIPLEQVSLGLLKEDHTVYQTARTGLVQKPEGAGWGDLPEVDIAADDTVSLVWKRTLPIIDGEAS